MRKFIKTMVEYLNENSRFGIKEITLNDAIEISQLTDIKYVGEWLNKPIQEIKYYYKEEPITMFINTIKSMESTYDEFVDERYRTEYIVDLLEDGNKPMAIFIELNDENNFIMEGRHRIVAFSWFGLNKVPVIYVQ